MDSDVPQSQHKNEVILPKDLNGKEISRFLPLPQLPLRKRKFKDQEGRSFKRRKLWRQGKGAITIKIEDVQLVSINFCIIVC